MCVCVCFFFLRVLLSGRLQGKLHERYDFVSPFDAYPNLFNASSRPFGGSGGSQNGELVSFWCPFKLSNKGSLGKGKPYEPVARMAEARSGFSKLR